MSAKIAKCDSCGADIVWIFTEAGRKAPLDARPYLRIRPNPDGDKLLMCDDGKAVRGDVVPPGGDYTGTVVGRISHFATCPKAHEHRRGRA